MAMKKVKQGIAAALAAALVLQGAPMPVQAAKNGTIQEETVQDIKGAAQTEASGVNVAYHTQDEIRNYIKESGAKITDTVAFQENPVTEAPFSLGRLSDETLDSAVRMLNQIRYIAGIPYDVVLDEAYNEKAQAASLVNYVNGKMTHEPTKPEGMTDEMFALAESGAGSSNIAWGSSSSFTVNYFIAMSWMKDGDSSNIDRVGHRRWLLNPSMKKTGFGVVNGPKGTHSAVYAFDRSASGAGEYGVMWPAQNMPTDYFNTEFPWSVSMGTAVDDSAVQVKLTRNSDGKEWNFSASSADGAFYVNNDNYGQQGCIIFRPDGVDAYENGDSYRVEITGLSGGDVSYTVHFFSLDVQESTPSVESVSVTPSTVTVTAGKTQQFTENVAVKNGAAKTVTWSVSGNTSNSTKITSTGLLAVAEDEEAKTLTVRATSTVDMAQYGEATITVLPKSSEPANGGSGTEEPGNGGSGTEEPGNGGSGTEEPGNGGSGTEEPGNGGSGTEEPGNGGSGTEEPGNGGSGTVNPGNGGTDTQNPGNGGTNTQNPGNGGTNTQNPGNGGTNTQNPTPANPLPAKGKTYTVGNLKYRVTKSAAKNGAVTVTGPKKKTYRTISIPNTVKIKNYKFKVTAIGSNAFRNNKNLRKVVIGDNVTTIGASAFQGNTRLTTVIIGKGVTKMKRMAFFGDKKLATIKINTKKLKTVEKQALKGISNKAKVSVPKGKAKAYKKILKKGGLPAKATVK